MAECGTNFVYDYDAGHYKMANGSPVTVTGTEAVKEWFRLFLRTLPGRAAVYGDTGFGVSTDLIIGYKTAPRGFLTSEVFREIREGAVLCPFVRSVSGCAMDGSTVSFTALLTDGTEGSVTVEL